MQQPEFELLLPPSPTFTLPSFPVWIGRDAAVSLSKMKSNSNDENSDLVPQVGCSYQSNSLYLPSVASAA